MPHGSLLGGAGSPANKLASRIESQTENIKSLTNRIERITQLNVDHAHQLGYYEAPKDGSMASAPMPVTTSLDDALRSLERAVDSLDGSMNLFN